MTEPSAEFSEAQKQYLEGLARGVAAARSGATTPASLPSGPERIHFAAQDRTVAAGGKLTREEEAKRAKHPFDMWDEICANAERGEFPKGTDVFLYKFHGLFHVAPAQDAFMCRLRNPNGILDAPKLRATAAIAEEFAAGHAHVTTRSNIQIREIPAKHARSVLERLAEAGLTSRGAGADNIRNITSNPTAGIDPAELFDTRPLGLQLHHAILNHRELYGLPRKFNIAFDGGCGVASLEDTNDIGFSAVRVPEGRAVPAGTYFRVAVGGITGHGDFAADLGVVVTPAQCLQVATAIVRVFIDEGDRTDRKRARLKYVLDRMGHAAFLAKVEERLPAPLPRLAPEDCEPRPALARGAHMGFHPQRDGKLYCGISLAVGRMTSAQMRGIAGIAEKFGDGAIRLTPWQNVIVSGIAEGDRDAVSEALAAVGLTAEVSQVRAGLVACTGNTGCKFSASDTKRHALAIADHVDARLALDAPLNIHLTGCPHSCAQHFIGDIGLLGTKVAIDEDTEVEGYHLYVGGGFGDRRKLAREILRDVKADVLPSAIERLLLAYTAGRNSPAETFQDFVKRHSDEDLKAFAAPALKEAA